MHNNILSNKQIKLLPTLKDLSSNFGLVGGTALALQIGHRQSIDFDLFTNNPIDHTSIRNTITKHQEIEKTIIDSKHELTIILNTVKITFYQYPFDIQYPINFNKHIMMPDILTLSAMKAYALGRRSKWKDYADIYYVLKQYKIQQIIDTAKTIYKGEFDEKQFREQLTYHDDIDYTETINYMPKQKENKDTILNTLTTISAS